MNTVHANIGKFYKNNEEKIISFKKVVMATTITAAVILISAIGLGIAFS